MNGSEHFCYSRQNRSNLDDIDLFFLDRNLPSVIFVALCLAIGLPGNISVFYVYCRNFRQSNFRIYVLFLACIDTLFCLTVLPFYILNIFYRYRFIWDVVCRTGCFLTIFLSLTSLVILVVLAIDRYIVVQKSVRAKYGKVQGIKSCITAVFLSGTLSWYSFLLYGVKEELVGDVKIYMCTTIHKLSNINSYVLLACSLLLSSFFAFAYGGVWSKIKVHARRSSASSKTRKKTVVIYVAITTVFSVSTILTVSLNIVREQFNGHLVCHFGSVEEAFFVIFTLAHCLNHVVNPIIYYCRDQRFQQRIGRLFQCSRSIPEPIRESSKRPTRTASSTRDSISTDCKLKSADSKELTQ